MMYKYNRPDKKHREQAANMLLLSPDNKHMVFSSDITINPDGSMSFEVRDPDDDDDGDRYLITLKIEEI